MVIRMLATVVVALAFGALPGSVAAATGPEMVKDIRGNGSSNPLHLTQVDGWLYFTAETGKKGRELWKSDGTTANTVMVKNIRPGRASSSPDWLTDVNGTLYFTADDGTHGRELWASDGTAAGTHLVEDINPNGSSNPQSLTAVGNRLFFSADDGITGRELWKSNGTLQGTKRVKDILAGSQSGVPEEQEFEAVGNLLYFGANESPEQSNSHDVDLWKSDGTAAGTKRLKDLANGGFAFGRLFELTNVNGTLFFIGQTDPSGLRLFTSNGTKAGTVQVPANPKPEEPSDLANIAGLVYFVAIDPGPSDQQGIWTSDGTGPGTQFVSDPSGPPDLYPERLIGAGNRAFFQFQTGSVGNGADLWTSDGTPEGTYFLKSETLYSHTVFDGKLYFEVLDSGLWHTDGTTTAMDTALPDTSGGQPQFTTAPNQIFFVADDGTHGRELWRYVP